MLLASEEAASPQATPATLPASTFDPTAPEFCVDPLPGEMPGGVGSPKKAGDSPAIALLVGEEAASPQTTPAIVSLPAHASGAQIWFGDEDSLLAETRDDAQFFLEDEDSFGRGGSGILILVFVGLNTSRVCRVSRIGLFGLILKMRF